MAIRDELNQLNQFSRDASANSQKVADLTKQYQSLLQVITKLGAISASNRTQEQQQQLKQAAQGLAEVKQALEEADKEAKQLDRDFNAQGWKVLGAAINDVGDFADTAFKKLYGGWKKVSQFVQQATANNNAYFQSLNQIVGINGKVGELGETLRNVASGTVGKQQLAEFFGSTGSIIAGAKAMEQQAGYARDLIAAYGSVQVAAEKYQNIQLLSIEDQKTALKLAQQQAKIVEQSAAGQLNALKTQGRDAMDSIGASLLYSFKPVIEFMAQVAQALKDIMGLTQLDDQVNALARDTTKLTEDELRVQEELNEIERLKATGFTSSLDEVHETGSAYVEASEEAEKNADITIQAEEEKQEAYSKTNERVLEVAQSLKNIFELVMNVGETTADVFTTIGPPLLDILSVVTNIVAGFFQWAQEAGVLKGVLIAFVSVLAAVKVAQLAYAAAVAATKIAQAGLAAPLVAGAIAAGVGVVTAVILGAASGGGSTSNSYGGIGSESNKPVQVSLYIDRKKLNDELAEQAYYEDEVKIG